MESHQQKDAPIIIIPYSCKNDIKLIKEVGLELIDKILAEEFNNPKIPAEIQKNYKNRLQSFHAKLIRDIKEHVCLSKNTDYEVKKEVTEYSERDEKLSHENDKLLSDLHKIIEKNRNTKQLIMERIKTKVKQDFEKCKQQTNPEVQSSDSFDVICIEGENCSRSISKEKFLKSFQENYTNKLKHSLECHRVSYENFETIYNNRKHTFFDVSQRQNELVTMLTSVNFDLSAGEKALFEID